MKPQRITREKIIRPDGTIILREWQEATLPVVVESVRDEIGRTVRRETYHDHAQPTHEHKDNGQVLPNNKREIRKVNGPWVQIVWPADYNPACAPTSNVDIETLLRRRRDREIREGINAW